MIVDLAEWAGRDAPAVVELASQLIKIPTRATRDDYTPIVDHLYGWLDGHGLHADILRSEAGDTVGVAVEVAGGLPGPAWVLDACVDTAPFGDESAWRFSPTAGEVVDGWLLGRGAADSKLAASLFCHLAAAVAVRADQLRGSLVVLLDADEHSGNFGGAKAFFDTAGPVAGVMIGYPGIGHVVVGGRGVLRAVIEVSGVAQHSGSSRDTAVNAALRAAYLINELGTSTLPGTRPGGLGLPPKLTVTSVHGGDGFSIVPDLCEVGVDVRLTDQFGPDAATHLLRAAAALLDEHMPGPRPTFVDVRQQWPAYQLAEHDQPAAALLAGARAAGLTVTRKVAGPANIGNYLAGIGIPATAGFGVPYEGLHGIDERADVRALPLVHVAYHHAILRLLGA
jgi:succinyl-diaminopimelate desuccinylase